MPRPRHTRIIRAMPQNTTYKPQGVPMRELKWANLSFEGLEALRLVDAQGLSQAQAAEMMGISTPTLCRVLGEARGSIAQALSQGWAINIEGGNYRFLEPENEGLEVCVPPGRKNRRRGRGKGRGMGRRCNPNKKEDDDASR